MKKLLCLFLSLSTVLCCLLTGCGSADKTPKLSVVYVSGNETSTVDAAGRIWSQKTEGLTGTKNGAINDFDEALTPVEIPAGEGDGTVKLVLSAPASELKIYRTDGATGETQQLEPEGDTVAVEGKHSYGFRIETVQTSGNTTYEMEYAFDLIYTPEVGELGEIVMPEASQSVEEPEEEPAAEVEEPAAEEAAAVEEEVTEYKNPPQLTVKYNGTEITPQMGTTSWNYVNKNGKGLGFEADSQHPLSWSSYQTIKRIYNIDEMYLSFPVWPDEITVSYWKDTYNDPNGETDDKFLEKVADGLCHGTVASDGSVTFDGGYKTGYIYVVECSWGKHMDEAGGTWSGSTVFAFALSETNY